MLSDEESVVAIWFLEMESRKRIRRLWIHPLM
jgi:hypothetical protein